MKLIEQISCRVLLCAVTTIVLASGCGGCGPDPDIDDSPVEPAEPQALAIESAGGCTLDSDCTAGLFCFQSACVYECGAEIECADGLSCSARGQCLTDDQIVGTVDLDPGTQALEEPVADEAAIADYYTSLEIAAVSANELLVSSENDTLTFELELTGPVPADGMPYRVVRSDGAADETLLLRTEGDTANLSFPIAPGLAVPSLDESTYVFVEIITPVGRFKIGLQPAYPASGTFAGTAELQTFGNVGIPIDFEVVTEPTGSSLEDATTAWLLMPVASDRVFSPVYPDGTRDHVAAELEYDDFLDRWVATYDYAFDLDLANIWDTPRSDQVGRSMRFEIEYASKGEIRGSFTDRWLGLYEADSAQGVTALVPVESTGELTLLRVDDARAVGEVDTSEPIAGDPQLLDEPTIDECSDDTIFAAVARDIDGTTYGCDTIASVADFENATAAEKASCAIAIGDEALSADNTTGAQIRAFLDDTNTTGQSFEEFLQDCAAGANGACQPTAEINCGRQLLARAYHDQASDASALTQLIESYLAVARESYLGRQMAAFSTDLTLRKTWLASTDYPAVVTNAVQDLNEQLLDEWRQGVLDVHVEVLTSQFDPSGLAVMARDTNDETAADARQRLILEMAQSWRGAMDSMVLATRRWNELLQAEVDREEKASYVTTQMFKLYVSANALRTLAQSADSGFAIAGFGSGFATLSNSLRTLGQGFDERVYARDGEVVVNTSLDPEASTDNLLTRRQNAAIEEIDEAHESITGVLAKARAEALDEAQLRNRMNNQINDLRTELVELCGLPTGCSIDDWANEVDGCEVNIQTGGCGFDIDPTSGEVTGYSVGDQNVSEAGASLVGFVEAARNVNIAGEDLSAQLSRQSMQQDEINAFAADIVSWNERTEADLLALEANIAQRQEIRNASVKAILDAVYESAKVRANFIADTEKTFQNWQTIRMGNITTTIDELLEAQQARQTARELSFAGDTVQGAAEIAAASIPPDATPYGAATTGVQAGLLLAGFAAKTTLEIFSLNKEAEAEELEILAAQNQMLQEAELERLQEESDLDTAVTEAQLAELQDEITEGSQLANRDIEFLQQTVELARAYRQSELTYERDIVAFRGKRNDLLQMMTRVTGLELRVEQAQLQMTQQALAYLQIVQTAQLRQAKLDELIRQRENINQLVGSPAAIFSRANDLQRAERKLQQAKDLLMDWLVALEYYAVRPFMDQRLQIILARNTYQLEEIADELTRLQRDCGGPVNSLTTTLSIRDDFLGLSRPIVDTVTGEELTPADRFRAVLERGLVPLDKRVRYSADDSVGSLMARSPDILSATFFIELGDFANLELTCNAKVDGVKVNLVGQDLGDGRPTVTLLYDGTSTLLSCQPGIDDYVAQFGVGATTFGSTTQLRAPGRSMSPVATINAEAEAMGGEPNASFAGLPLATQYTVLINREAGENGDIDWSKLEDIELELTYSYQDIFPDGQCQ